MYLLCVRPVRLSAVKSLSSVLGRLRCRMHVSYLFQGSWSCSEHMGISLSNSSESMRDSGKTTTSAVRSGIHPAHLPTKFSSRWYFQKANRRMKTCYHKGDCRREIPPWWFEHQYYLHPDQQQFRSVASASISFVGKENMGALWC